MNRFVTIFEKTENFHLIKDVGQIPYLMHRYFGYDSTLVTYKNNDTYPYLKDEVEGLKLRFIPKIKFGRYSLSVLVYIFFNAKKIDILHLFHHRNKTYLNFLIYKWRNPNGIAFLKSDLGLNSIHEYDGFIPKKRPKYRMRKYLFDLVLPKLDIISIESEEGCKYIQARYPDYSEKILFMPNGINVNHMYELVPRKYFAEKENIILTVGRIGAPEKNNEMLLSAIESIELGDWKVVFIGPIEKQFRSVIELFYHKNPQLKEKVIFTDAIYERKKLFEWYARSKIFCLSSTVESFGFVLIEAMVYANYIISTPISSANEITDFERAGKISVTEQELIQNLKFLVNEPGILESVGNYGLERAITHYDWKLLLNLMHQRFLSINESNHLR